MGEKVGLYLGINGIQLVNPIIYISFFLLHSTIYKGFPGGSDGKASACNVGDQGSIPGLGRPPWRRKWQPTPVLLSGKFHGLRSLVGYSPRGHRESDVTERLHFHFQHFVSVQYSLVTVCILL